MLALTVIGAIAVFFSVLVYVGEVNARVGNMVQVLRLTQDVNAFEPIDASVYEVVEVPERWVTPTTLHSENDVVGLVAAAATPAGSVLQGGMVIERPGVQPGYREIAIVVDAETGVAGKVSPGARTDIIATIAATDTAPARAEVWVSNALVLEVGVVAGTESQDSLGNFSSGSGVPVTFSLTAEDALRLAYVESFSTKLRLALRGSGDDMVLDPSDQIFAGN
jgi:Flp pilus assembly protein CpaB